MKSLRDFPFADDAAITAHSTEDLAAHEPFQEGLPRFWADHQPEEDTGYGSECGLTSQHCNLDK